MEHHINLGINCILIIPECALLPHVAAAQTTNPEVTQDNIRQTICTSGWTKTVRPPQPYTDKIKRDLLADFGGDSKDYELDHVILLAVGGHPTDPQNLALQAWEGEDGAKAKDVVETRVKRLVCVGRITLAQGQQCFIDGWRACPRH
jgi:hypothetical protein